MQGLILFDFDGTLYSGDAPFRYYAEVIGREMEAGDRQQYISLVESHLGGNPDIVAGDNWEAVVQLSAPFLPGEDHSEHWGRAFNQTREYMLLDSCPLEVSPRLLQFLEAAQGRVTLACASNSPPEAAIPLLERLNLLKYFDEVVPSAKKPAGLIAVAAKIWGEELDAARTASVGDNYKNDIAPAHLAGWWTAHVSPRGYFPGPADAQGYVIDDVLPSLQEWLSRLTAK